MSVFKCKMCGGTIAFEPGATVGVCDHCGTKQTLPRLDDERRANLYDRANHFRRNNEFDKAAGLYEQILNEDPTDAEAYWSLVLCRYGIEYVEDPAARRRVPTVNRTQYTSVFDDGNYRSALQYADVYQRSIYEQEAAAINEIQKGILAISEREQPFDVFVCYKEADANGRRTVDSVLATELYHQLTQEGFKVFFSRITLEDKLGTAYEPYIFAALNSAKVMVVLGTRPEYFNAVWVKNEWSRYLNLIKAGAKKTLIPAYRDMDPYDLPEEFSHLMALDMSRLGFMQDLIRGIKKIIRPDEPKPTVKETVVVRSESNVSPLLRRAFLFLEDGNFSGADEYCERVLDQDPENARAYLGKLMAQLHVRQPEELADCEQPFDGNNNYQKAIRFGDESLTAALQGYIDHIKDRIENERLTGIYERAVSAMNAANGEAEYKAAAEIFGTVPGFRDADALALQCRERAETCRKDAVYTSARAQISGEKAANYEAAIKLFQTIPGWRDSDAQLSACQRKLDEIVAGNRARKAKEEAARLEREREDGFMQVAANRAAKRRRKKLAIIASAVIVCLAFAAVSSSALLPGRKMRKAIELYESGNYSEAAAAFEALGSYQDAETWAKQAAEAARQADLETQYLAAVELAEAGEYEKAIAGFEALDGYRDSAEKIAWCEEQIALIEEETRNAAAYAEAEALEKAGDIIGAYEAFAALGTYRDSADRAAGLYEQYKPLKLKSADVGDYVFWGNYEQDNNSTNGKEHIEWLVLAKEKNRLLVISKYALDCQQYNTSYTSVTWETCSLRKWLNGTFLSAAFSEEERAMIPSVTFSADKNPRYSTSPGNSTTDQVFLLSFTEVNEYFSSDEARKCAPTAYAIGEGAWTNDSYKVDGKATCWWWLRSPGGFFNRAANVGGDGSVHGYGSNVHSVIGAVRPALWIKLVS